MCISSLKLKMWHACCWDRYTPLKWFRCNTPSVKFSKDFCTLPFLSEEGWRHQAAWGGSMTPSRGSCSWPLPPGQWLICLLMVKVASEALRPGRKDPSLCASLFQRLRVALWSGADIGELARWPPVFSSWLDRPPLTDPLMNLWDESPTEVVMKVPHLLLL